MQLIIIIVFAVLGLWLAQAGHGPFGIAVGAVIGYLVSRIRSLQIQMSQLEEQLRRVHRLAKQSVETDRIREPAPVKQPGSLFEPEPLAEQTVKPVVESTASPVTVQKSSEQPPPISNWRPPEKTSNVPTGISPVEKLFAAGKEWISTGNVPVKVGVIVSFFGVSFLLKYAVERQFIVIPIEARYLAVAIGAGVLLTIGWRLRNKMQTYALSLQGGGIGILYLTIFSAFRLHPLLPAPFAFVLLVLLTAFTGMLAVLQNARWLAIFGTVGGFLAPVLVSTGSGNHVALFSYYLLLNAAILGIA